VTVQRLPLTADEIADVVWALVDERRTAWSMGVQGALAEFAVVGGEPVEARRSGPGGRVVEAVSAGGGLRLVLTDDVVAFADGPDTVLLAVPRTRLPLATSRVRSAAGDGEALRPEDRDAALVDLGIGHSAAAFCVRTADPELVADLRALEGATWRQALDAVGHRLVAASPHRVVTGPLGRIEVYNAIPAEAGASPEGCHTHLLPARLKTGRELAADVGLPPQLAAGGNWTNPGWGAKLTFVKSPPT
jgi:hypothetical protein